MSLADELLKLEQLHQRGMLSVAELEVAKRKLLDAEHGPMETSALERRLEKAEYEAELARIDREWSIDREKYMSTGRHGARYVPTTGGSLFAIIFGGGFCLFWIVMAATITGGMEGPMGGPMSGPPFGPLALIFPLFGVVLLFVIVGGGLSGLKKAEDYKNAEKRYQERRAEAKRCDRRTEK